MCKTFKNYNFVGPHVPIFISHALYAVAKDLQCGQEQSELICPVREWWILFVSLFVVNPQNTVMLNRQKQLEMVLHIPS